MKAAEEARKAREMAALKAAQQKKDKMEAAKRAAAREAIISSVKKETFVKKCDGKCCDIFIQCPYW